jgi:hypothetical protein
MAHALQETCGSFPNAEVVFRFIGATPSSTDGRSLLESICRQISRRYKVDESNVPTEYSKLAADFSERLKLATENKPLFIFLDALDQLSSTDHAQTLSWLPSVLPENVHIVVSCLPGGCLSILEKRLMQQNVVLVKPMSRDEGKDLLIKWLHNVNRCLLPDQEREVLDKFAVCGLPLFLKLAFEEARQWKSYTERIELSPTVPSIILGLFKRLSSNENYGEKMFSHSLGYLAAAKNGLTEDELLDVLSLDAVVFDDFKKSSFHELTGNRLPVVVWSRLYLDLEPYLIERSADGTSLLGFYHRQFDEAVIHEYLKEDVRVARHALLGRYFNGDFNGYPQPLKLQDKGKLIFNLRKLSELPFQETYGELWSELENTLTDLAVIEAKCSAGMTYGLVADYNAALDALPEGREEKRREAVDEERVKKYTEDLIAFARGKISFLEVIPSVKIWSAQKIEEEKERIRCDPTRLDHLRAYSSFVNSENYAFAKFSFYPMFCTQHAYNFAPSGAVADAAEKRVSISTDQIILLRAFQRDEYNPHSALLKKLSADNVNFDHVCFTLDGKIAISAGARDYTLQVWDIETYQCKKTLTGHTCEATGVCCTPDGKLVISASTDRTLRVWDIETGECIACYLARAPLTSVIAASGVRCVHGELSGGVVSLQLRNLLIEPQFLTPVRLWQYGSNETCGCWANEITAACSWCGKRFVVETKTIETNQNLSPNEKNLKAPEKIDFNLQLNLTSNCPFCNKPIKFNSFIVDNKNRH